MRWRPVPASPGSKANFSRSPTWKAKAGVEGQQRVAQHAFVFLAELAAHDGDELFLVQVEDGADHAQHEQVLAAVARGAADGFDGGGGERHADVVDVALVLEFVDLAAVVDADAAVAQRAEVLVVAVLVEGHEHIRLIACVEHFTGAKVHLENGRPAADGGRDGHVGHHLLRCASGEARQKAADGLDAVLRISREADDSVAELFSRNRRGCDGRHGMNGLGKGNQNKRKSVGLAINE